jgi:hypothetical protein
MNGFDLFIGAIQNGRDGGPYGEVNSGDTVEVTGILNRRLGEITTTTRIRLIKTPRVRG